jgi:hypothetical protein
MKWMFPIAVTLVLVLTMMSPNMAGAQFVTTAPNIPGDPGLDTALGSGHVDAFTGTEFLLNFAAHSGPLGQNASGHFHFETIPGGAVTIEFDGDVTCLNVVANLAMVGGFVTKFVENGVVVSGFQGFLEPVEDNHSFGVPDRVGGVFVLPNAPSICPPANPADTTFAIDQGNIVVHDADL